jgi:phosphatidylserine/phosphatidylglycerophosphate/cardiolipin synthase-like enzyme
MTQPIPFGVSAARVALVADSDYRSTFLGLAGQASSRLLCSVFIVDISPTSDRTLTVDGFLRRMAEAAWRGADTRLLIGGSRDNIALVEAADSARSRASALGVPCRWLTSRNVRGSHAKLVIADDQVLTGSHNWSPGALLGNKQTQDSVLVSSRDLAAQLAGRFEAQWLRAEEHHAAV